MNDLMRNETIGYSPGRPTSGGESGLNLWAGIPNFGTLGTYPMPYPYPYPKPAGKYPKLDPETEESYKVLTTMGCDNTNSSGGTQWGPRNSMGQNWTCPNVTTVDVDLRSYMPKSKVDSLSRFVGSNKLAPIPFKLTAYYYSKGNTPGYCTCSAQRFEWCDCAGSALIGVTSDIELDLMDKLEPFVGQNCGRIRASVEDFAVNFWNWKEKAVLALLQKVLQGCHDNYQQSDDSLSPPPPTERAPGSPTPPPPSLPPPTMEAVAATATAEAHTWKLTAMILGLVLAAVLLLVAAVFLVVRATSNSGSAASSAAPEMEMM